MNTVIPMEALGYQKYEGAWYTIGTTIPVKSEAHASEMEALRLAKRKPVAALLAPAHAPMARDMAATGDAPAPTDAPAAAAAPADAPAGTQADAAEVAAEAQRVAERKRGKYNHRAIQPRT